MRVETATGRSKLYVLLPVSSFANEFQLRLLQTIELPCPDSVGQILLVQRVNNQNSEIAKLKDQLCHKEKGRHPNS